MSALSGVNVRQLNLACSCPDACCSTAMILGGVTVKEVGVSKKHVFDLDLDQICQHLCSALPSHQKFNIVNVNKQEEKSLMKH